MATSDKAFSTRTASKTLRAMAVIMNEILRYMSWTPHTLLTNVVDGGNMNVYDSANLCWFLVRFFTQLCFSVSCALFQSGVTSCRNFVPLFI